MTIHLNPLLFPGPMITRSLDETEEILKARSGRVFIWRDMNLYLFSKKDYSFLDYYVDDKLLHRYGDLIPKGLVNMSWQEWNGNLYVRYVHSGGSSLKDMIRLNKMIKDIMVIKGLSQAKTYSVAPRLGVNKSKNLLNYLGWKVEPNQPDNYSVSCDKSKERIRYSLDLSFL
jgi:hypothetical protein